MHVKRLASIAVAAALAVLASACAESAQARRYNRKKLNQTLQSLETPGVIIGEFELAANAVVDGDTIKVEGLETSLRLLAIDTEETYKNKLDRRDGYSDFAAYMKRKRAGKKRPVKVGTPMGDEAKKWAKKWFKGVERVRLERDHPKEIRGRYGRYLAYVWAYKNGKWLNYNVECVRAGMAPYFTKYSYSRRFHDEFVAAEKEAREAKRGIWNPASQAYDDYDVRKKWWNARAEFIKAFEQDAKGHDDFIVLTHWDSLSRIEKNLGKEITLLGLVGEIRYGDKGPTRVLLSRRMFNDFPVIFFDKEVFMSSQIQRFKGEFVRVTGVVNLYQNKYNKKRVLQMIVSLPSQVTGVAIPGFTEPITEPTAAVESP